MSIATSFPDPYEAPVPKRREPYISPFVAMSNQLEAALELVAEKQATIDKLRDLLRSARDGSRAAKRGEPAR